MIQAVILNFINTPSHLIHSNRKKNNKKLLEQLHRKFQNSPFSFYSSGFKLNLNSTKQIEIFSLFLGLFRWKKNRNLYIFFYSNNLINKPENFFLAY